MSAAVLDPTATATTTELPDLTAEYTKALKQEQITAVSKEPTKEPVKEAAKEPVKETVKEPAKEVVQEAAPTGKKSALDAALADDVVPQGTNEPDEVTKLIESKDPNWDKARETMKRQSDELKNFREKIAKASEPAPEIAAELKTLREERERLKRENDEYRDSVMAIDVRLDPGYQQKQRGRDTEVERVASYVKEAGGNPDDFINAMNMPIAKRGKYLDAILDGIESTRVRSSIEAKLGKIETVDEELESQLAQPHKSFDELQKQRQIAAREQAEHVEQFKQATFEKVQRDLPKLSKLMRPAPADAEGADEFNAQLKADLERAPKLLQVAPEEAAVAAYKAARYDSVEKLAVERFAKDGARIRELETALAKFEGAEPGFRGNGKATPKADWERPITDVFAEALTAQRGT